ncbi:MAG: hypothetical protein ACXAC2_17355 [Candidatus Kariarchaeaceae archaeon]|jgi:hypothetical protein
MAVPPSILFSEFAVSGVSPSGSRHLDNASNFIKNLSTNAGAYLNYGLINNANSIVSSPTKVAIARVSNFNDANEAVFNMKFWVGNINDFQFGNFNFNGFPSGIWLQDFSLTDQDNKFIPTELPSGQNIWRAADGPFDPDSVDFKEITASGLDDQVTMYEYLSVTVDTDVPPKTYGGDGGEFQYRLTFDFR